MTIAGNETPLARLLTYVMVHGGPDRHERMLDIERVCDELEELRKAKNVDITSDGVNPSVYTVPDGVILSVSQNGPDLDQYWHVDMEGPYEGELPEPEEED